MRAPLALFIFLVLLVVPSQAQSVFDAVYNFPAETTRLEFCDLNKLRGLPDYAKLRERYMGPRIQTLERILLRLGIQESDIETMLLGWAPISPAAANIKTEADGPPTRLFGLARGRFAKDTVVQYAAANKLHASKIGEVSAYCFDQEAGMCVMLLDESVGAFGTRDSLAIMQELRDFRGTPLSLNSKMMKWVPEIRTDVPIWGISTDAGEWFRGWVPDSPGFDLDWPGRMKWVEAAIYTIDVRKDIQLQLKLDCNDADTAALLGRFFDGFRFFYQLLWHGDNSLWPKPLTDFQVTTSGRRFELKISTPYR